MATGAALILHASTAAASTLPAGFQEKAVFSGLSHPTVVSFAPDGRVFVAEKSGLIKIFDGLGDPLPTVFADLSTKVHNYWDRGLLGMALDPQFPTRPYVYVAYALDALPGGSAPAWGGTALSDGCPTPPGPTTDGCVVTGRVAKLTASGDAMTAETPLITDWCQQFPSHSMGALAFGPEGALYVSGGEGADFISADWGQSGDPLNPCDDPPGGIGGAMSPPLAEGGALRAQDVRTEADSTGLGGTVLRIDPDTGAGLPDNPLAGSADANARRIVAYGFRNPFRLAVRPGSDQVWVGDVGWGTWEEINRVLDPDDSNADNFGWPCYEGGETGVSVRAGAYEGAGLNLCKTLYDQGTSAVLAPYLSYNHAAQVIAGETCSTGSSSTSGLAFYAGSLFPAKYDGALFFADYSRDCIWAMLPGAGGVPSPTKVEAFDEGAAAPVNLVEGPDGALYYPDFTGGKVWRVGYSAGNAPPVAVATATPQSGPVPLQVQFSAAQSTDPDPGSTLSYAWDLDGDGELDDSTEVSPEHTYDSPGARLVKVEVTDFEGASDTASVTVQAGNTPPMATIETPDPGFTWGVGDPISFAGAASDSEDGDLPASAYTWNVIVHHCPSNCHEHTIETVEGDKSWAMAAPDHEYPSWLEVELTVTDSGGLTDTESVDIQPRTAELTLESSPPGIELIANDRALTAASPSLTAIEGSTNTVIAPSPQVIGGVEYVFEGWSDGGAAAHEVELDASRTLTATYARPPAAPSITTTYPNSPANTNRPRVSGVLGVGAPTTIAVFANSSCSGQLAAAGSAAEFVARGIAVRVPSNATTTLSAEATNAVGYSPCSSPKPYVEDSTPPETTLARVPARKRSPRAGRRPAPRPQGGRARFQIGADEEALRFECSLDDKPFRRCAPSVVYPRLKAGRHRLAARAADLAGNVDATPAARLFRIVKRRGGGDRGGGRLWWWLGPGPRLDRAGAPVELLALQLR